MIVAQSIPYRATNELQYLKFIALNRLELPDYIKYVTVNLVDAVFFYSPETQKRLQKKNPSTYRETPDYVNDKTEEVFINGALMILRMVYIKDMQPYG